MDARTRTRTRTLEAQYSFELDIMSDLYRDNGLPKSTERSKIGNVTKNTNSFIFFKREEFSDI